MRLWVEIEIAFITLATQNTRRRCTRAMQRQFQIKVEYLNLFFFSSQHHATH